jgi:hypothetical protein
MAVEFDWLNDNNLLISNVTEVIYANPAATKTFIYAISLHNTHSSAVEVTLYKVPDNAAAVGTAAAGNQIFKRSLAAYETFPLNDVTHILGDTNDSLQAVADVDAKVTINLDGAKQT